MSRYRWILLLCCLAFACQRKSPELRYWNLLVNPETVDCLWDTTKIDFGTEQARAFLGRGWVEVRKKNPTFSRINSGGSVVFYCAKPAARSMIVRARSTEGITLRILPMINGRSLTVFEVSPKFENYPIQIPAQFLRYGRNFLNFQIRSDSGEKSGVDVDFLEILSSEDQQPKVFSCAGVTNTISSPVPGALAFHERIPENAELELEYFITKSETPGARLKVVIENEAGEGTTVFSGIIRSPRWYSRDKSIRVDLKPYANRIVRLLLQTTPEEGHTAPQKVGWSVVRFRSPRLEKRSETSPPLPKGSRPHVILYVMDAIRADHLQTYGYSRATSPNILEFSRDATVFENAYAQTSWTRASIATMLTGLYPSSHLTQNRYDALSSDLLTMPAALRNTGYATAAFTNQPNIGPHFGFDRAFGNLHLRVGTKSTQSELLMEPLKTFLDQHKGKPQFLYIHTVDAHAPFSVQEQFQMLSENCDARDPQMIFPQKFALKNPDAQKLDCVVSLYDSGVRQSDEYFGRFLALLKQRGLYENSIIILTADHGENFLEHEHWGHGNNLYEQDLRVPLIVRFPGRKAERIHSISRHIDLFPTVLQLAGMSPVAALEGRSLLLPPAEDPFFTFAELKLDGNVARSILWKNFKLIQKISPGPERYEFFNVQKDPEEKKDIAYENSVMFGYMKNQLTIWSDAQTRRNPSGKKPPRAVLDKETEDNLRALGYLQ